MSLIEDMGCFLTRSSCFTACGEWRHDSDVCSIGVNESQFSKVAVNLFVYILSAGIYCVTMCFVVMVTLVKINK